MVVCSICGKKFFAVGYMKVHKKWHDEYFRELNNHRGRNNPMFGRENKWGYHTPKAKENIRKCKVGDMNPAKRLDVRRKISEALKGKPTWNKGMKWNRSKIHDAKMEKISKELKSKGLKVLTTHQYVPDAIVIDFKNKIVKAFELNPRSVIEIESRAKLKGYDDIMIKVMRNRRR